MNELLRVLEVLLFISTTSGSYILKYSSMEHCEAANRVIVEQWRNVITRCVQVTIARGKEI